MTQRLWRRRRGLQGGGPKPAGCGLAERRACSWEPSLRCRPRGRRDQRAQGPRTAAGGHRRRGAPGGAPCGPASGDPRAPGPLPGIRPVRRRCLRCQARSSAGTGGVVRLVGAPPGTPGPVQRGRSAQPHSPGTPDPRAATVSTPLRSRAAGLSFDGSSGSSRVQVGNARRKPPAAHDTAPGPVPGRGVQEHLTSPWRAPTTSCWPATSVTDDSGLRTGRAVPLRDPPQERERQRPLTR